MPAKKKTTTKKPTTKQSKAKPKTKVVYKTRTVYRKVKSEDVNPLKGVMPMVATGATAIIGLGFASAVGNALKNS
jgi:hypothetical protein